MAEYILRDLAEKRKVADRLDIASAATSSEELGNPVYPPARRMLEKHGIRCDGKRAVRVTPSDYDRYDHLICMDEWNVRNLLRIIGGDPQRKIHLLMDYTDRPREVTDPWYTDDFDAAWNDIREGCEAFLDYLIGEKRI